MKKIFAFGLATFLLSGCAALMTTKDAATTVSDSISSSVNSTTDASKSSSKDKKDKNWEYAE